MLVLVALIVVVPSPLAVVVYSEASTSTFPHLTEIFPSLTDTSAFAKLNLSIPHFKSIPALVFAVVYPFLPLILTERDFADVAFTKSAFAERFNS